MFSQIFTQLSEQSKVFSEQTATFSEPLLQFNRLVLTQIEKSSQKQLALMQKYSAESFRCMEELSQANTLNELQQKVSEQLAVNQLQKSYLSDSNELIELAQSFGVEWQHFFENLAPNDNTQADSSKPD